MAAKEKCYRQSPWESASYKLLRGYMKPRVMDSGDLYEMASRVKPGISINTFYGWIAGMESSGVLTKVLRGLYVNNLAIPKPSLSEIPCRLIREATISLHTVLGETGVLNNPSGITMAVVPVDDWSKRGSFRPKVDTGIGTFWFFYLPRNIATPPGLDDTDLFQLGRSYACATPEKAFMDWIYLGSSARSKVTMPPLDIDASQMDIRRVKRIAKAMGLTDQLESYIQAKASYDADADVSSNMSRSLGL